VLNLKRSLTMAMQACPLGVGKERLRCCSAEDSLWVSGLMARSLSGLLLFFALSAPCGF